METEDRMEMKISSRLWLEIKSDIPGQQSILVEHRQAYEAINSADASCLQIVLIIGSESKRRYFNLQDPVRYGGICIRPFSPSIALADCEMHTMPPQKMNTFQQPKGEVITHRINQDIGNIADFSLRLYWRLLAPFASAIILFLDDLGGLENVQDILSTWLYLSMKIRPQPPPKVLVLQEGANLYRLDSLRTQIHLNVRAKLKGDAQENIGPESTTRNLDLQLDDWIETSFQSIEFIHISSSVFQDLDEAVKARNDAGFDFTKLQLIHLLRDAIQHFSINQDLNYNFYYASRKHNPIPISLKEHISKFLITSQALKEAQPSVYLDQALIIASALEINAYPPGMHCKFWGLIQVFNLHSVHLTNMAYWKVFAPDRMFDELYDGCIDEKSNFGFLGTSVRSNFLILANKRRRLFEKHKVPSASTHIKLLQRFKAVWAAFYHSSSCFVCLSQTADRGLTCGHRLCDPCVILSGSAGSSNSWAYHVKECPLCKETNENLTPIRPPTAGNRVLKLSGRRKPGLIKFLEDMRRRTAYMAYHFKPHKFFDIVIGIDTGSFRPPTYFPTLINYLTGRLVFIYLGAFFGQTVFLQEWPIADCKHHLKRVREPEIHEGSKVSFGKGLTWDLEKTGSLGGPLVCLLINQPATSMSSYLRHTYKQLGGSIFSTSNNTCASCPVYACNGNINKVWPYLGTEKRSSDLIVEYDESTSPHFLQPTASRMLACLFYIELASSPDVCPDSISVHLRIQCRVPPGPSLIALLRLPLQNAQLHYWAETREPLTSLYSKDGEECKEPLSFSTSVTQHREGFLKNVTIKVKSLASVLHVGISTVTGLEMISRCPYSLQKLMQDQGFYSVFGRKDHRIYSF